MTYLVAYHHDHSCEIKSAWQQPNSTEFFYFNNHINILEYQESLYIGYSWANHIDNKLQLDDSIIDYIASIEQKKITICQHISWEKLLGVWKEMKIDIIYVSHYCKNTNNPSIKPWPLYASSVENMSSHNNKIKENRKYFVSFIGCHRYDYRSNIRLDLNNYFHKNHYNNIYFELYDHWFYDRNIYGHKPISDDQIKRIQQYNEIVSDSVFSLCPEGTGPNTIRVWESMALGSIPVIYSDDWEPPKLKDMSWDEFSIFIPQKEYNQTMDILNSINKEKIQLMQQNCIKAYEQFKNMNCWNI